MEFKINGTPISGENLDDAIENNFDAIATAAGVGNPAGWQLDRVYIKKIDATHGDLHIIARGGDNLIGFDPTEAAKETILPIEGDGITESEATFAKTAEFDPRDFSGKSDSFRYGIAVAVIENLIARHCKLSAEDTYSEFSVRFPNMESAYPAKFVELYRQELARHLPKPSMAAQELQVLLSDLLMDIDYKRVKDSGDSVAAYYKTRAYFARQNKITALQYYRQKAGKTQAELASEVGISARQLQGYEAKNSSLGDARRPAVMALARALGVTADNLVSGGVAQFVAL